MPDRRLVSSAPAVALVIATALVGCGGDTVAEDAGPIGAAGYVGFDGVPMPDFPELVQPQQRDPVF